MRRRRFLAALPAVALAGCNALAGPDADYVHFLTLYNYTDAEHRVELTVHDDAGETIRAFDSEVPPVSAREHVPIRETPSTATLRVNDREPRELDWPGEGRCDDRNPAGKPGLELRLMEPEPDSGLESPRLHREWTCQSVSPERARNQTDS